MTISHMNLRVALRVRETSYRPGGGDSSEEKR